MADKLLIIARREYLERVRSRWFIVMTLLVPVLLAGAFLVPAWLTVRSATSANARNIIVLDATGAGLGRRVVDNLAGDSAAAGTGAPQLRTIARDSIAAAEADALRQVMTKDSYVGYLVLDDSTLAGTSARYAGRNASAITVVEKLQDVVRRAVTMVRLQEAGVSDATIQQVSRMRLRMSAQRVDDRGRGGSGQAGFFLGLSIALMLFLSVIVHGQAILRGTLEEKTTRVAEVVLSSVKPETLLAGKVLGVGAVGLTQQILWIAIGAYLITTFAPILLHTAGGGAAAGVAPSVSLSGALGGLTAGMFVAVLLFFLVGFVFYASLFAAAGAMVNSEQEAQQAVMPVTVLIMAVWLCVNPVLMNPSGTLAVVLSWLPFSSPIILPMRMGLVSVPWWTVTGSLVCGVLGCVFVLWLSARIYRVGMLMYGKRPSFAEVARWIRYA